MPTDCDPRTKTCRASHSIPQWMTNVANYWILSFHWRVNEKHWQNQEQQWCAVGPITSLQCQKERLSWLASRETVDTHKSSVLADTVHKQMRSPPHTHTHTPDEKPWQTYLNLRNNNDNNNRLRGALGRGGTVTVAEGRGLRVAINEVGGLSSAHPSAAGIHLWCLHLPSPA